MFTSEPFTQTQGGGLGDFVSSTQDVKRARTEEKFTCMPVTVRSIEAAVAKPRTGNEVQFFGSDVGMLVLVGVVENVSRQAATMEFVLNDSTGRVRVKWFASDVESKEAGVEDGKYVCLAGSIRLSPSTHISATTLRLVRSADEISYHMISAAHTGLKVPRDLAALDAMEKSVGFEQPAIKVSSSVDPAPAPAQPLQPVAPAQPVAVIEDLRKSVLTLLEKQCQNAGQEGVEIGAICALSRPATDAQVTAALTALIDDGDICNTIDDNHFAIV